MVLYIIRHADPDYAHDTITPYGREQAEALGVRMGRVPLDRIYTSPMGRAIATAQPTLRAHGKASTVLDWTAENGDYMSQRTRDGGFEFSFEKGVHNVRDFSENDRSELYKRMIEGSDAFLASLGYVREGGVYRVEAPSDERVAVFCHGGFGSNWIAWLLGMSPVVGWGCFNRLHTTSVTRFDFRNDKSGYTVPECEYFNDISHLRENNLPNG